MAQKIIILPDNKYCSIDLGDEALTKKLSRLLSYKEPGVEFTPAYQRHGWNGINYLLNNGKFPIGLLDMVKIFCHENMVDVEIVDQRLLLIENEPIDISKQLAELKKVPRYYQINAAKSALECRSGIIKIVTGGGKSVVAAILTAALNKQTNIYVIGLDLLQQFHDLFTEIFEEEIGYIGNGVCEVKRINIVSLWSASKALNPKKKIKVSEDDDEKEKFNMSDCGKIQQMIKSAKLIIIDECHASSTESFKKIYSASFPENIYGMSATPHKGESSDLLIKALLGNVVVDISASELIEKGFLISPKIKFFSVPPMYVENRTYAGIYKEYVVENNVRNKMIVDSTVKLVENGFQTLVLFRQISHGKHLFEMLKSRGVDVDMLSGKDKLEVRNDVKSRLLSGELRCVISSSIYDTGIDISSLNGLVLASPNKSLVRALQRIGRVVRPSPGKTEVRVVDFYDNIQYLKAHSKRRYQIYKSESGFDVSIPNNIKL